MGKIIHELAYRYYKSQEKHHGLDYKKGLKIQVKPWFEKETIDFWRHGRMYTFTDPLTKSVPRAKWLTVGDGRYGRDAHYLESHGANVMSTDINDGFLKEAKKKNYIKRYKKENAEKLSFNNNSFDFVLCKESYHHFPRPVIALYEMLRVARQAIVLIEPNDVKRRGFSWSRFWSIDKLGTQVNRFEASGNYVYTVSRREMEKVALGVGLPVIAFAGFDDIYFKKMSGEKILENTINFRKIKFMLWVLEIFYRLGLRDRSLLVSIIFKVKPLEKTIKELKKFGYDVKFLPRNPYVK